MIVVDYTNERRKYKLSRALAGEHVPIFDPFNVPDGDYYLIPAAWMYKKKWAKEVRHANKFSGKRVLMDYAREMLQLRKNVTGLKTDYLVTFSNKTPNKIKCFPFSMPEFDPGIATKVPVEKKRPVALVTMERQSGVLVTSLIRRLKNKYRIVWKMKRKYGGMLPYYKKKLIDTDHMIVCPKERDYNWPVPLLEVHAQGADIHVHIGGVSTTNLEMVRFGVPTYIWTGNFRSHRMIGQVKKWYEGKPKDYCTQNLIRNLRENLPKS